MDHADHVQLIRDGVAGAGVRWLELGAGEGAFTLALADVLGPRGDILVTDRDGRAVGTAADAVGRRFPAVRLGARRVDFTHELPAGPFDGVLAANTLHFVARDARRGVLEAIRGVTRPGGRLVVVEYDADHGNSWVPHPFSFETWRGEAARAGFGVPRLIGRVPSRFLGAIYGAVVDVPIEDAAESLQPSARRVAE